MSKRKGEDVNTTNKRARGALAVGEVEDKHVQSCGCLGQPWSRDVLALELPEPGWSVGVDVKDLAGRMEAMFELPDMVKFKDAEDTTKVEIAVALTNRMLRGCPHTRDAAGFMFDVATVGSVLLSLCDRDALRDFLIYEGGTTVFTLLGNLQWQRMDLGLLLCPDVNLPPNPTPRFPSRHTIPMEVLGRVQEHFEQYQANKHVLWAPVSALLPSSMPDVLKALIGEYCERFIPERLATQIKENLYVPKVPDSPSFAPKSPSYSPTSPARPGAPPTYTPVSP